ncbi:spidroin-1-like isoform X1 [Crassostrea angulata]|uniref:spidroin-1-like isoform X1 n=1 Tax=Magallana angulata TaxID=2784310 RepID=UPI0022B15695|nr:spidroin-1-like isoform X1 [Crassostrea angulata]
MISVVALLCLVAGTSAIPIPDYYPKTHGFGGLGINGRIIDINDNAFESSILGFNGGNSASAAASAASGLNSAAAAAAANAASDGSRHFGQQGALGFNNGFGFNGGNSAAASAAAAAGGMNSAAAAAASSAQRSSFTGFQGHSGHQLIGSNYGPFVQQVPSVQFQSVPQFTGLGGSAAAAAAAAAGQQSAAAAAAAAGQNAAAAAAAAAGRNAAAAAAASASGANFGLQNGVVGPQFAGQIGGQFGGQFVQPAVYYPNVVGQNSGAAAAAAAASNNAAAAAAAASASGFNGGIIRGSTGIIGSRYVPGKKY